MSVCRDWRVWLWVGTHGFPWFGSSSSFASTRSTPTTPRPLSKVHIERVVIRLLTSLLRRIAKMHLLPLQPYNSIIKKLNQVIRLAQNYYFEDLIENYKLTKGVILDTDLKAEDWKKLIKDFLDMIKEKSSLTSNILDDDQKTKPVSYTHLTLPTKRIV